MLLLALTPVAVAAPDPDPDTLQDSKVRGMFAQRGGPRYRRTPRMGFDCGGLVAHVFERAWAISLPRRPEQLAKLGKRVSRHVLEVGDLLFYNTRNQPFSHVGIYVGDGRFIHAPKRGLLIRAESMDHPYWAARFNGARRLPPPA
jgi:cell wall-associated NlpC family hydrolase